jgi:hypothetical protein
MGIEDTLREFIDSPMEPIIMQLRQQQPGVVMPSVPIPRTDATEFLHEKGSYKRKSRIRVFDLQDEIVMVVQIKKGEVSG